MNYLLDSSAIYTCIRKGDFIKLEGNYTIDLAFYELGNIIWKSSYLHKTLTSGEKAKLTKLINGVLSLMSIIKTNGVSEGILKLAEDRGLTYYDASYVFHAIENNLILVTEDKKLLKKVRGFLKTVSSGEL
ncbi:MAG: type II toxin-antitoxin system VapC family toxin [Candidatus Njordarchaeia archaeon]